MGFVLPHAVKIDARLDLEPSATNFAHAVPIEQGEIRRRRDNWLSGTGRGMRAGRVMFIFSSLLSRYSCGSFRLWNARLHRFACRMKTCFAHFSGSIEAAVCCQMA